MPELIDNPVWGSLVTAHATIAIGNEFAKRYPSDVTPFVAVASSEVDATEWVRPLVPEGEKVYFVGIRPKLDARWVIDDVHDVFQYVIDHPMPRARVTEPLPLADRDAMREMTAEVYPYFFRERTASLGAYFGVREGDRLVAMGGERMKLPGFQEISTICTRPGRARKGLATAICGALVDRIMMRGEHAFAHTVRGNEPMIRLFEREGWTMRSVLPMWTVRRTDAR